MNLFIDIETIPTQREDLRQSIEVHAPRKYKKQESIDKWMEENYEAEFDKQWRKTALDGSQGEIICISWAIDDEEPRGVLRTLGESENDLLNRFNEGMEIYLKAKHSDYITDPIWIGHNICDFDLRFIWQRFVVNGIKPVVNIPHNTKPWDKKVFDTLYEWKGDNKAGGSMNKICKIFGIEDKGDIDGSKVWDYVKAGKEDEVFEYCKDDVRRTQEIYRRIRFL